MVPALALTVAVAVVRVAVRVARAIVAAVWALMVMLVVSASFTPAVCRVVAAVCFAELGAAV